MKTFIFVVLSAFLIVQQCLAEKYLFTSLNDSINIKEFRQKSINNNIDLSSLFLSFNYSSNTNTFGSFNQFVKQPSYSPSIIYISKYGFDISGTGYWIENSDDSLKATTSEFDLSFGYNFTLFKNLNIYPGYSHFFYNSESNTIKSAFTDNFSLYLYYQFKKYIPGISANYLLGSDNTFYFTFQNSFTLSKENLIFKNSNLDFQPGIDINFSNQSYYVNYFWESLNASSSLRDFLRDHPVIRMEYIYIRNNYPNLTNIQILNIISKQFTKKKEEIRLSNISLYLPVSYMIGNFILDVSLLTYFPINQPDYFDEKVQIYFDLGISYILNFNW